MSEPHECPRLMEVHRLWEGELSGGSARKVRRHLEQCAACRAEVESWDGLSGLLARGDPARSLVPERRERMKEALLERCGASPGEAGNRSQRSAPVLGPWRWRLPRRVGLALAPLALVGLLWVGAGGRVPLGRPPRITLPPGGVIARPAGPKSGPHPRPLSQRLGEGRREPAPLPGTPLPVVGRGAGGEGRTRDHATRTGPPPIAPRRVVSHRVEEAPRRPRRVRREVRMKVAPRKQGQELASSQRIAAAPEGERTAPAPGASAAAPGPIERIVIQVGGPPPDRAAEVETVTRITVVAAGDLTAPDAALTIVKTQKEEALP